MKVRLLMDWETVDDDDLRIESKTEKLDRLKMEFRGSPRGRLHY